MQELHTADELALACAGDSPPTSPSLLIWAAQGMTGRARAWSGADGPAAVVACPDLTGRDRAAVWGDPDAVAPLVADVLPVIGLSYRLLGCGDLIPELSVRLPWLAASNPFGWMYTPPGGPVPGGPAPGGNGRGGEPAAARWLDAGEMDAVTGLLNRSFPDSYAWPGMDGVRRWAGLDGPDGRLAAVAADAWSAPTVGFMAGVAVSEEFRGAGLGGRVCAFVADELIARHGRVALMVHGWNDPAIRLYHRLGLTYEPIRAGWVKGLA